MNYSDYPNKMQNFAEWVQETPTLKLAKALIERPSITPKDEGCQNLIAERLENMGFQIHHLPFENVQNLFAIRSSKQGSGPILAFAGHTDVVPTGALTQWQSPPFSPTIREGYLYGRGAADMKGSLAAMVCGVERFLEQHSNHSGSIVFIITSDEEGPAHHGTQKVMEHLKNQGLFIDYCIVGEPSSREKLGDTIKVGRRGSLSGHLKIYGLQGHVAYPDQAQNAIHLAFNPLLALSKEMWDEGNEYFPATTFQISNIQAGTGAGNVIPGILDCHFNLRFSNEQTVERLQAQILAILNDHSLNYEIEWQVSALPFLAKQGLLLQAVSEAIEQVCHIKPALKTDGGTSDARFIAVTGTEVIELGPCNATIHQINECVSVEELNLLTKLYESILTKLYS